MASYQVKLTRAAEKQLEKIDNRYRQKVEAALEFLGGDPYQGKKLSGEYKGYYSVRIWPYRVIYTIKQKELWVIVVRIAHRQGVYR